MRNAIERSDRSNYAPTQYNYKKKQMNLAVRFTCYRVEEFKLKINQDLRMR
ncbi:MULTISPECIES: hypothetical protein [Okeania]|uniref:hypothetical protein n=1 Tax=Okeania TaxID=1458928 RepID=UPI00137514A1|nr:MULTISPECIES: hypothetical protein [Okeania]